jgi:hypothetical protein
MDPGTFRRLISVILTGGVSIAKEPIGLAQLGLLVSRHRNRLRDLDSSDGPPVARRGAGT